MAIESPVDPVIGRTFGPYRVTGRVGTGGMGTVYRAVHTGLDQARAIKTLLPHLAADPSLVERFSREARTAARLRHPNIVQIYDVGAADGVHYIAMELVVGRSLDVIQRIEGCLPVGRVLHLLGELASALDAAHALGVVHRDVKPSNAIVGPNDHLTLVDFGIARALGGTALTGSGVIGTPEYMAPELLRGKDSGPSVDQYALGVVAYELFTGQRPFRASTSPAALLYSQAHDPPPAPRRLRPDLPKAVEAALLRQLAKEPGGRHPTCVSFVEALKAAVGSWTAPSPAVTPPTLEAHAGGPEGPNAGAPADGFRPATLIPPPPSSRKTARPTGSSTIQTPLPPAPVRSPTTSTPVPHVRNGHVRQSPLRSRRRGWLPVLVLVGVVSAAVMLGAWLVFQSGQRTRPSTAQASATVVPTPTAPAVSATSGPTAAPTAVASGPGPATTSAPNGPTSPAARPTDQPRPAAKLAGPVPQLREPRSAHAATLLADGQLLVVGGRSGREKTCLGSAERYDLTTNSWSPAGQLAEPRAAHTATLLSNGQVLVTGGIGQATQNYISGAERYDSVKNAWTPAAAMTQRRGHHTATLLPDGRVLAAGGWDGGWVVKTADLYDPATDTWSPVASMTKERHDHTATLLPNGRVLVVGGWDERAPIGTAELYDPTSNTWSPAGTLAAARRNHTATLLQDGRVLVVGGYVDTNGTPVPSAEIFDPVANVWQPAGVIAEPRGRHTATLLLDGTVLVAGGGVGTAFHKTDRQLVSAELYTPATNSWRRLKDMSVAQDLHSAWRMPAGEVLLVGGYNKSDGLVGPQWFDPASLTWTGARTAGSAATTPATPSQLERLRTMQGHTGPVKGTAFSPDGQYVVSGAGDKTVMIWRASDGAHLRTLEGHSRAVWSTVFSPDGMMVATSSEDGTIKLWRAADGALLRTLDDHIGPVYSVAFAPGGTLLVSGGEDMSVKVWRVPDGRLLATLDGHEDAVMSVAFAADHETIASGSADTTVKLWSFGNGTLLRTLEGHTKRVWSVAFSPDGKTVLSASGEARVPVEERDNTIRLWRVSDGAHLKTLIGHDSAVTSAVFSPDGDLVASTSLDTSLLLWRLADGKPMKVHKESGVAMLMVAFSRDGRYLVSGSRGTDKGFDVTLWAVK